MSQYDFGTIDPYVVDGVQLADMLNQWRSAIHSWHRGASRPSYVVPGMMWINDTGGATNWVVNVYLGPTPGDVPVFSYNTTTGAISISTSSGGSFTAAVLLAQAAANPSVQWNATGNPIDSKNWRMTENATGALVLSSYTDAGVIQQSITFNRDGTFGPRATFQAFSNNAGSSTSVINQILPTVISGNSGLWYSTSTGRFTPPAGRYRLHAQTWGYLSTGNTSIQIILTKNGTSLTASAPSQNTAGANLYATATIECIVDANGTDWFNVQTQTGAALSASFAMFNGFPLSGG